MPKDLFYDLDNEKRMRIFDTAITEFATYGYLNSSTNRIVKNCGISKGSLFKYFDNKEDLYFYILDHVSGELIDSIGQQAEGLSKDLFNRVLEYSELEFSWYIKNPDKYKLIADAFMKKDTEIYQKIATRYHIAGENIYYGLLKDIDTKGLRWDLAKTAHLLKWLLEGFNQDFKERIDVINEEKIENIKYEYVASLKEYLEILKTGLIQ